MLYSVLSDKRFSRYVLISLKLQCPGFNIINSEPYTAAYRNAYAVAKPIRMDLNMRNNPSRNKELFPFIGETTLL